ncbi:50S ribosomal protein L11 methyltransferase [Desulfobacterales bacterium HSG16]|nr:50S ribosomal protein L11 methyltransferase [Desulfobacterales bacterium HSG16]
MTDEHSQGLLPPYKDLHIYYFQGHISPGNEPESNHFIGNWQEDGFSFLFFVKSADKHIDRLLSLQPDLQLLDRFQMTYDEWQGERLAPFSAGGFSITPPWYKNKENIQGEEKNIILDPGVVFGNGLHPTTHDCMDMIEILFASEHSASERVKSAIDLGTGTGLLALAVSGQGCDKVLAADLNYLAAKTAHRNIILNGRAEKIMAVCGNAVDLIDFPAELLIANIHYDVMKRLIPSKGFLAKKWFILSGLLSSEAKDICDRLLKLPVEIIETRENEGIWHTFFGRVI